MAIIRSDGARPMLRCQNDRPEFASGDYGSFWHQTLGDAATHVLRAVRATARVDTPGAPYPFMGTAFAVAPRLALTMNYIGEALLKRAYALVPGDSLAQLDFGDSPPSDSLAIGVREVELLHPFWKACFLVLDRDVPSDRILELARSPALDENGRDICVIGFPARDLRNDQQVVESLLGDGDGVKHIMPGRTLGLGATEDDDCTPVLRHDASTLGGTGGAPVINLADGRVVGLQYAGRFLRDNQAILAWQLARDPQWSRLADVGAWQHRQATPMPGKLAERALAIDPTPRRDPIFTPDELLALANLLIAQGLGSADRVRELLSGLPPEMLATLPLASTARGLLMTSLEALNRMRFLISEHLPIYHFLNKANFLAGVDPHFAAALARYCQRVLSQNTRAP